MQENLEVNPDLSPRIEIHQLAIHSHMGTIKLYNEELGNSETSVWPVHLRGGQFRISSNSFYARSTTLSNVLELSSHNERVFIKCDIEGSEYFIFDKIDHHALKNISCILLSLHPENLANEKEKEIGWKKLLSASMKIKRFTDLFLCILVFDNGHWVRYDREQMTKDINESGSLRSPILLMT